MLSRKNKYFILKLICKDKIPKENVIRKIPLSTR